MPAPKRKTPAQLQAQCDKWNAVNPVGTAIAFENIRGQGTTHTGKTTSEAQVMGGHSAVLWFDGKSGAVSLDHCMAVDVSGGVTL